MKPSLMKIICCPDCKSDFELVDPVEQDGEIESGRLACEKCNVSYPIIQGLPSFIENKIGAMKQTGEHFGTQWVWHSEGKFEKGDIYSFDEKTELADFTGAFDITDGEQLAGTLVMDAGCGSGRLTGNIGKMAPGATVVGVDISNAAFAAHARNRKSPNVHTVQANLMHLPFREGSFGTIWSEGVIHATPSSEKAFDCLDKILDQEKGNMFIAVYMKRALSPYKLARDILIKPYILPKNMLYLLCGLLAIPTYMVLKLRQWTKTPDKARTFKGIMFKYFDNLGPEFQHRHTKEEVDGWFKSHGFKYVRFIRDLNVMGRKQEPKTA